MTPEIPAQVIKRKVVASFKRHLNLGNYDSAELFMSVEDYVDLDANPETVAGVLRDLSSTVKATLIDEAGLEFEVTDDGVILEVYRKAFGPETQIEAGTASQAPAAVASRTTTSVGPTPPHDPKSLDWRNKDHKPMLDENRAWAAAQYVADPSGFYDNRADKPKQSSPDFKHKASNITIWESDVAKARR